MKNMDRLYERLTPVERFQIAVAAFGRGDMAEVDRLNDTTGWKSLKIQEPAYFNRLQKITWLALYFTVRMRNVQITALAGFAAIMVHLLSTDSRAAGWDETADLKFDDLVALCSERIAKLKGLHAAWLEFCTSIGLTASDVDGMTGLPFMGGLGNVELIQEIVGEVPPDGVHQQECLDAMKTLWKTKLEDRVDDRRYGER